MSTVSGKANRLCGNRSWWVNVISKYIFLHTYTFRNLCRQRKCVEWVHEHDISAMRKDLQTCPGGLWHIKAFKLSGMHEDNSFLLGNTGTVAGWLNTCSVQASYWHTMRHLFRSGRHFTIKSQTFEVLLHPEMFCHCNRN